jgi:small glutamine-rich tetratricopeptide repeat-containing protein alpha
MAPSESKKRLALAIIDFLSSSLKDGTLTVEDADSIEIAQNCIAEAFKVDPSDNTAMQDALRGQSLNSIYSVYEKMIKGMAPGTAGTTSEGPVPKSSEESKPKSSATPESDRLKSEGNAAMGRKDYDAAISLYTEALEIAPSHTVYLSNRAAAYSASGQHENAAADAELAVSIDPNYSKAWSRLGLARSDMGNIKGAQEAYEKGIEAEGNGGSDAMRRGLETSRKRVEEMERAGITEDVDEIPGAPRGAGGGMPDLSSLAGMLGGGRGGAGGGMPDLSSMMSNPMFANMAQNLMSNPETLNNLMSNPRLRQMAENFGGGGGMPDMSTLMSDPNIAEMARNMMGGGGRGASS